METKVLTPTEALAKFKTNFYYAKKYNYPYGGKVEESDVYQTFAKLVEDVSKQACTLEELGYTLIQNDESELFFARYAKGNDMIIFYQDGTVGKTELGFNNLRVPATLSFSELHACSVLAKKGWYQL